MLYKVLSLLALSLFIVNQADDYFDYSAEGGDELASASFSDTTLDDSQQVVANDNSTSTDDASVSVSASDDTDTSTDDDDDDDDEGLTSDDDDTDTSTDDDQGLTSDDDDDNNSDESDTDSSASSESSDSGSDSSTDDTDTSTDTDNDNDTDTDDMTAIASFDTDSDDPCDDADDEDDCHRVIDASGNQLCGYNAIDDECYGSVRRAGTMGVGGFDAGYVAAQEEAKHQSSNLRVIIGVLGAIIGILFMTVAAGGYYFYAQSKKQIEQSIHEAQNETVSPMEQTIDINEKPMQSNHNESDVSPMMIQT